MSSWQIAAWLMLGGSTLLLFMGMPVALTFLGVNIIGAVLYMGGEPGLVQFFLPAPAGLPGAQLRDYVAPKTAEVPAWFTVKLGDRVESVAVNPYTAEVIRTVDRENTVFAWAEKIHGTLLIGDPGDWLIEIAAGFGIVGLFQIGT